MQHAKQVKQAEFPSGVLPVYSMLIIIIIIIKLPN
jgi:hypothetical protein